MNLVEQERTDAKARRSSIAEALKLRNECKFIIFAH